MLSGGLGTLRRPLSRQLWDTYEGMTQSMAQPWERLAAGSILRRLTKYVHRSDW